MDDLVQAAADLVPLTVLQIDAAALDLDDGDPDARPGDNEVGFAVLLAIAEPLTAEQDGVVRQVLVQRVGKQLLGVRGERGGLREPPRRHSGSPVTCTTPPWSLSGRSQHRIARGA